MGCPFPQGTGRYLEIRVRRGGGFVRLSKLGHKTHLYLAFCHVCDSEVAQHSKTQSSDGTGGCH